MVFDPVLFQAQPGEMVFQDRFREVEVAVCFRKGECYNCGFVGFYKFQAMQLRRNDQILASDRQDIRADHVELWKGIPRFAEIPQTVKCKRCREVMGFYTNCIF